MSGMEPQDDKPRAFGMAPGLEAPENRRRPAWANPMLWGLFGAVLGAGIFVWSQRQALERAARRGAPIAQAKAQEAARRLERAAEGAALLADDLAKDAGLAEEPDPDLPRGITAAELEAPTDPTGLKRPAPKRKGVRRRTAAGDMPDAGKVQDVRARWDAPDVTFEAKVPWSQTEMGRGALMSGGLALFFGFLAWALFSIRGNKPKSF